MSTILFIHPLPTAVGNCSFQYLKQPPSTTISKCSPYHSDMIVIALECVVRKIPGVTTMFEIKWFRENTTGVV